MRGDTWGFGGQPLEHIETHAAHVFLVGDCAFKMKKAVKLPYLDFSTVEKRKAVLERELEINRAFAPSIYLRTDEVRGEPVLVMNRFDQEALLSSQSGGITDAMAKELARMVADSHVIAPRRETLGKRNHGGIEHAAFESLCRLARYFPADEAGRFQISMRATWRDCVHSSISEARKGSSAAAMATCIAATSFCWMASPCCLMPSNSARKLPP